MRQAPARWILAIALVVPLAACGLPKDGSPREIAADKVPFDLLGPSSTQSDDFVAGGTIAHFFFVDGAKLRSVSRAVEQRDVRVVLDLLVNGVTATDPLGITTAIPNDTRVIDVQPDGDNGIVVTLSNEMLNVQSTEQRNAFAQLVYTATDLGVSGVRFRVLDTSGNPQDVLPPTDQGPHAGPLTRSDYQQEAPG